MVGISRDEVRAGTFPDRMSEMGIQMWAAVQGSNLTFVWFVNPSIVYCGGL